MITTKRIFQRDGRWFLPIAIESGGKRTTLELSVSRDFDKTRVENVNESNTQDVITAIRNLNE